MSTKPSTGRPDSLLVYDLARLGRTGRPMTLVYRSSDPRQRKPSSRSSRMNDGYQWALAAWAEVMGLEPVMHWRTDKREPREARPWRDGSESALTYLHSLLPTGMARSMLADLARRSVIEDDPRYHRKQQEA